MSLTHYLVGQFQRPHGAIGHVAGWIMSGRVGNQERNVWTLDLLEIEPDHRVLEIGFGPGYAIEQLLKRLTTGRVAGIDHSNTMVRQTRRRNREAVRSGQVELHCDSVVALGSLDRPFDRVYSSNVAQFWQDRVKVFRDILGLLRPGGRVATTYLPRHRNASDQDALDFGLTLVRQMQDAGFTNTSLERGPRVPLLTVSAVGSKA